MKRRKKEETVEKAEEGLRRVEPKELEQVNGGATRTTRKDYDYGSRTLG